MFELETTPGCHRTPIIVFVLEELDADYEVVERPAGYFAGKYAAFGPSLVHGDVEVFQMFAAMRYAARQRGKLLPATSEALARCECWMEIYSSRVLSLIGHYAGSVRSGEPDQSALEALNAIFAAMEGVLADGEFMAGGTMSLADCQLVILPDLVALGVLLDAYPSLQTHCARLRARPSFERAMRRLGREVAGE